MAVSLSMTITQNSQSAANNTSNVTVAVKASWTGGSYNATGQCHGYITIDNVTYNFTGLTFNKGASMSGSETIMTETVNVEHGSDGKKTLYCSASFSTYVSSGTVTTSGSLELTAIARASSVTLSTTTPKMGDSVTISVNRASVLFTHTLRYKFGSASGTISKTVSSSHKWTVPTSLAAQISGKLSGTGTVYCDTYSGETKIGTTSVAFTATVPDASKPTLSKTSVQMGSSVTISTNAKSSAFTHTLTYTIGTKTGTIGTKITSSKEWTVPKGLAEYTGGKTSASCTITCKTYNGEKLVGTEKATLTLTVPDATVPTVSETTVKFGSAVTISTPKQAECYTHDLSYTLYAYGSSTAAATGSITQGQSADKSWTIPLSLAAKIPSSTRGTIVITCKTRIADTDTVVGTETVTITATVPNTSTTKPSVSMALSPMSSLPSKFSGLYLTGKTKVMAYYTASSDYSTISSYKTTALGTSGSGNPYTSALIDTSGAVTVTGTVTDARGYYTTKTGTITVIPYSRPRVIPGANQNRIICTRCTSTGVESSSGTYLLIKIGRKYSPVESGGVQLNSCTLKYRHKTEAEDDSAYSDAVTLLAATASTDYVSVVLPNIVTSVTLAYTIQLIAEDEVGDSDTVTITIPTEFITAHAPEGGHGFSLGEFSSEYDVFSCAFESKFKGNVTGRALGLGMGVPIPDGANLNDYRDFNTYSVRYNSVAETILNIPVKKAGTLRVFSGNGQGNTTGDYVYIIQEYIVYDNSASYRRSVQLEDGSWEYGPWKCTGGADTVIEEGSGDGWYWRKWANGTAECWLRYSQTVDVNTKWGESGLYYGTPATVLFPANLFASIPVCNISVEYQTAGNPSLMVGSNGRTTTAQAANVILIRTTVNNAVPCVVVYHAIGRWK